MAESTRDKICTHCGALLLNRHTGRPAKQLYDEDLFVKSKILRLLDCKNCCGHHGVVDSYIEQEGGDAENLEPLHFQPSETNPTFILSFLLSLWINRRGLL